MGSLIRTGSVRVGLAYNTGIVCPFQLTIVQDRKSMAVVEMMRLLKKKVVLKMYFFVWNQDKRGMLNVLTGKPDLTFVDTGSEGPSHDNN